jgi:hypothetical protein
VSSLRTFFVNFGKNTTSKLSLSSQMARDISKLHYKELVSDFRCLAAEIGMPSNGFLRATAMSFRILPCFSHIEPETAESWLQAFARGHSATD